MGVGVATWHSKNAHGPVSLQSWGEGAVAPPSPQLGLHSGHWQQLAGEGFGGQEPPAGARGPFGRRPAFVRPPARLPGCSSCRGRKMLAVLRRWTVPRPDWPGKHREGDDLRSIQRSPLGARLRPWPHCLLPVSASALKTREPLSTCQVLFLRRLGHGGSLCRQARFPAALFRISSAKVVFPLFLFHLLPLESLAGRGSQRRRGGGLPAGQARALAAVGASPAWGRRCL